MICHQLIWAACSVVTFKTAMRPATTDLPDSMHRCDSLLIGRLTHLIACTDVTLSFLVKTSTTPTMSSLPYSATKSFLPDGSCTTDLSRPFSTMYIQSAGSPCLWMVWDNQSIYILTSLKTKLQADKKDSSLQTFRAVTSIGRHIWMNHLNSNTL